MKRLLSIFVAIAACVQMAQAYNFSATVPSGQTLYFSYSSGGKVYITYQYSSSNPYYNDSYEPTGELAIPGSIVYNGVKWDIDYIGENAFRECSGLTSVVISDSISSINGSAFSGCTGLKTVYIGNGLTSIGSYAFSGCTGLKTVYIGNGVTNIGNYAFNNCYSLNNITINSLNCPATSSSTFYGVSANATVYVPYGTAATYAAATGWSQFNNITEMASSITVSVLSSNNSIGTVSEIHYANVFTLTATANDNYHFDHWNDGNTDNPRTVILAESATFTAYFAPNQYTVSVTASGNGTAEGGDTVDYLGEAVLTATPATGYTFMGWKKWQNNGWSTDYYSTANPLTVQVTEDMQFQAVFERTRHTVTAIANDSTMGYVTGGGEVQYGTSTTLRAYAHTGYRFIGWSDGYTSTNRNVSVVSDTTFTANFEAIPQYSLSLGVNNPAMGSVSGGGTYYEGNKATFTATPNVGYRFTGWSDGVSSYSRTITMYADTTISANFEYIDYIITAASGNTLRGSVDGTDTVHYGEVVTLTAIPNEHYTFQYWQKNDGTTYGENPLAITVTGSGIYTAYFAAEQHSVSVYSDGGGTVRIGNSGNTGNYDYFSQLTLTATANGNNAFLRWEDGNTFNPRTVTITSDTTYTALFLNGTTVLHDTIHDTVYFNHYTHDTTYINNYVHDTVRMTTYLIDTTIVNVHQYDTTINNYYQYDTVVINNYQHDTTLRYVYDTVYLLQYLTDTVIIHDTIYSTEGIGIVDMLNAKVYSSQGQVVVEGAEGHPVTLIDAVGRRLATKRDEYMPVRFDVPASGTYLVKIGDYPARRVVVVR